MTENENPSVDKARFKDLAQKICDVLATEGIRARPWNAEDLPYFSRFSPDNRRAMLQYLEIYFMTIAEISAEKGSLVNSCRRMTERFLKISGMEVPADLSTEMKDGDFLSAYSRELHMIFLSPNHLQYMTYSIEDLFCRPWVTIFRRNEETDQLLVSRMQEFLTGQCKTTRSNLDIPPHSLIELDSPGKRSVICQSRLYSPLFRDGRPVGIVSINYPLFGLSRIHS